MDETENDTISASDAQIEALRAWHRASAGVRARARIAATGTRLGRLLVEVLRAPYASLAARRHEAAIANARRLSFRSLAPCERGSCAAVEGWVEVPGSGHICRLSVVSLAGMRERAERSFCSGAAAPAPDGELVLVPAETLTPLLLEEAVARWYVNRHACRRPSWALDEQAMPALSIDLSWSWPAERLARRRARYAERSAELAALSLPLPASQERLLAAFGHSPAGPPAQEAGPSVPADQLALELGGDAEGDENAADENAAAAAESGADADTGSAEE